MNTNTLAPLALVLCLAMPATAQEDICVPIGGIAENVMVMRQQDRAMSEVMAVIMKATPTATQPIIRRMVMEAYAQPSYSTDKMQKQAIARFRNQIELACYTARQTDTN